MYYTALSTFETLRYQTTTNVNNIPLPYLSQVSANGASRIQFVALPLTFIDNPAGRNPNAGIGEAQLLHAVPRVNGIPLIPPILYAQLVVPAPASTFNSRLQGSDRLDFNHGLNIIDRTVYSVEFPVFLLGGDVLFLGGELMVIRTFITAHART